MAVKLLKLMSGEEIVADVEDPSEKHAGVVINKPAQVRLMQTEDGGIVPIIVPWLTIAMSTSTEQVVIPQHGILLMLDPEESIANNYREDFGSGIITADTIPEQNPFEC